MDLGDGSGLTEGQKAVTFGNAAGFPNRPGTVGLHTGDHNGFHLTANAASSHTKVLGVKLDSPIEGNDAVAANDVPQETLESGEAVPQAVTGAQRLSSALQILKALEANDIVGQAASVDVSSLEDVTLWYGSRYEVMLGDTAKMEYKIACMNDAILQMSDYQSGVLDISFTIWPNQVGYTPFA